jgi:hypothetical protein
MNALWVGRGKQNVGEKERKRRAKGLDFHRGSGGILRTLSQEAKSQRM